MKLMPKIINFLRWLERYTQTDMVYVAKAGFWWIFGRIGIFSIAFLTMIAFAHWLPKETFGVYRYILSLTGILVIFSLPGMNTALIRAVSRGYEGMLSLCCKEKFKWGTIGSGICFLVSLWYFWHQNFILGLSFFIAAIFLPFLNSFDLFIYFWQGKKRFDLQSKYLILLRFFNALILIPVIFFTDNLVLIVLAYFGAFTFFSAIFFKITSKVVKNQETDRETFSFGKHLTLMGGAPIFSQHIDKIIIWQFLGPLPVAIYSFAQIPILRIHELIPIFPLALPKLSERNVREIKKELFKKFLKLFLVSIPLALFFILIAPFLYRTFFPVYLESVPYFQALALTLILAPFSLLGTSLVAEMRKKELYLLHFTSPFLQIILFLILIPFYGIWGAIVASLIASLFGGILVLYFFKKM